ncbi:MAG: hypothetical protein M3R00_04900 [Pseudomonadota bacterium]|nr:hypothetical protein [Pseudomonadota bacterium]
MREKKSYALLDAFEPGDLLFGLEDEARVLFHQDLKDKLMRLNSKYNFVTIDELIKPLESEYFFNNSVDNSLLETQSSPVKKHGQLFLNSHELHDIIQQPASPDTQEQRKFMLSCQMAIDNALGKIHFCLDGLNLNTVRNINSANRKHYHSFTSEELRYIAKHYQRLSSKVLFYRNGEYAESPWASQSQFPEEWLRNVGTSPIENDRSFDDIRKRKKLHFTDDAPEEKSVHYS